MASHGSTTKARFDDEKVRLGHAASGIKFAALGVGLLGVAIAVVITFLLPDAEHAREARAKFYHGWLVGIGWTMSIALGGLFFTLMQHMVKVGWSVNVRRVPEALAATLPWIGVLALPLLIPVIGHKGGELYPWAVPHVADAHHASAGPKVGPNAGPLADQFVSADPVHATAAAADDHAHAAAADDHADHAEHGDAGHAGHPSLTGNSRGSVEHGGDHEPGAHSKADYTTFGELTEAKAAWLNAPFFSIRIVAYFTIWTLIGWYYWGKSKAQDATGDIGISQHLTSLAPICVITFALTATFAAFDLLMSLDHHWFSTIFGVYVFAGGMISMFATTIITFRLLQSKGFVAHSVSTEHFHDLGKFMFAFTFFWGYVAFSQFMLQWYASLPEEVAWWARRGVTSADESINTISATSGFAPLSVALLFFHFLIPFPFLISRHIKRSKEALLVGAGLMLFAHLIDMYWLVMPEYNDGEWTMGLPVIGTIVGVIGLAIAGFVHLLGSANLRPIKDPRAFESMAFVNM